MVVEVNNVKNQAKSRCQYCKVSPRSPLPTRTQVVRALCPPPPRSVPPKVPTGGGVRPPNVRAAA
eukprot:764490-Prorocentrum_minimum.AAC.1